MLHLLHCSWPSTTSWAHTMLHLLHCSWPSTTSWAHTMLHLLHCSWPSTTTCAHTTNLTRLLHDEMTHAVVADFVWNSLVQAFRMSIKLPVGSARCLSHESYMAAFPSEVDEIHGLVCIGSIPAADRQSSCR